MVEVKIDEELHKRISKIFIISLVLIIFFMDLVSASNIGLIESAQWSSNLTEVSFSSLAFGDIDNDGDDDIFLSGGISDIGIYSKIYINNGTSFVESLQWEQNLTAIYAGSVSFNDINKDGKLDLILSGDNDASGPQGLTAKIYINNGTSFVESLQWEQNLTGTKDISIISGDINNDCYTDIAIGLVNQKFRIYLNNGSTVNENQIWQKNIQEAFSSGIGTGGIGLGSLNFGDYNNDGNLDLFSTGHDGGDPRNKLFENNGTTFLIKYNWQDNLIGGSVGGVDYSNTAFGDIDNDGDLDLVLNGEWWGYHARVFINNGTQLIYNYDWSKNIAEVKQGSFALGDYNNDGYLDLAWSGYNGNTISKIYENNGSTFIEDTTASANLTCARYSSVAWNDIDKDGDLDLVLSGYKGTDLYLSKVYISNASLTKNNTQPFPPNSSFSATYANNVLSLSWGNGTDVETNTSGLYYNLMIGNSTNNHTIVSGVYGGSSNPTAGYFGNMMQRKSMALNLQLEANKTYYWYVQTIDTGLAKSNWSAMQNFTTAIDVTKPNITINYPSANDSLHTINPYFIFNASVSDANLTNATLYADFSGTMTANETNSSGLNATYAFNRNLTGNNDKMYNWYIYACDSAANCQTSGVRSFYLDRTYPIVRLIYPSNGGSWTESNIVTFSYNVSDVDIANCSLIINNVIVNTSASVIINTTQNFTYSLSNGNYVWSVNCTDYVGYINSSANRNLTVSYTPPTSPSSGGGGGSGGAGVSAKIYSITNKQLSEGYNQNLGQSDKINFIIDAKNHSLIANSVNKNFSYANLSLNSSLVNFIIHVNEEKKFDVNEDNYYDLLVGLNNIFGNRANITIKSIREKVSEISGGEKGEREKEEKTEEEIKSEKGIKELKEEKIGKFRLWGLIGFVSGLIILLIIFLVIKYKSGKKKKNGRSKNR